MTHAACRRKRDVRRTVHGRIGDRRTGVVLASAVPDLRWAWEVEEAWLMFRRYVLLVFRCQLQGQ